MTIIVHAPNGLSLYQFCLGLIQRFQQKHTVVAVAKEDRYIPLLESQGIQVRTLPIAEDSVSPISLCKYMWMLIKIYQEVRPDIIHLLSPRASLFGTLTAWWFRTPTVCVLTGLGHAFTLPWYHPIRVVFLLLYNVLLIAKVVIFLNPDDKAFLNTYTCIRPKKSILIRSSGVNINRYKRNQEYPSSVHFLFVGRLMRSKGIYYFLNAAKEIVRRHGADNQITFVVAGSSGYGNQSMISKEDLDYYQHLLGARLNVIGHIQDIRPVLEQSSVLVLPTYYREGVPQSILEAMAFAMPIITTDRPGCRETVIEGTNGYLVPAHNVRALVHAMEQFVIEPHKVKVMGSHSRTLVAKHFSEKWVIEQTIQCYTKMGWTI